MISATRSFPVNPSGELTLSRSEVWAGLERKARNALAYVPPMTRCELIEEYPDGLLREIDIRGETHTERVTFEPQVRVRFERVGGLTRGFLENVIETDGSGELQLLFTFELSSSEFDAGSEAERSYFSKIEDSYADTVLTTLRRVREAHTGESG